jgi:hypothetical protein
MAHVGGGHASCVNERELARCIRKVAVKPSIKHANFAVNYDFSNSSALVSCSVLLIGSFDSDATTHRRLLPFLSVLEYVQRYAMAARQRCLHDVWRP